MITRGFTHNFKLLQKVMSDEERSDSLQSVEIPNEMYQQAIFNNNGTLTQMSTSAVSDLHQLEVLTGMSQQTLNDFQDIFDL